MTNVPIYINKWINDFLKMKTVNEREPFSVVLPNTLLYMDLQTTYDAIGFSLNKPCNNVVDND
jgi:hypothetical protein